MIKNKQVNIWRGDEAPPTLYHLWLRNENQLLKYDEEQQDWIVFLDSNQIKEIIEEFLNSLDDIRNATINGYPITNNITLSAEDLLSKYEGHYIKSSDTVKTALNKLDQLFTTKVYEQ